MADKAFLPAGYTRLLNDVKTRVRAAQVKAVLSINRELIALYWHIGRAIARAQKDKGYGKQVVERMAKDLHRAFPTMDGLSPRNVWRMRAFYLAWTEDARNPQQPVGDLASEILPQLVAELDGRNLPRPVAEIPWGHNVWLLEKVSHPLIRLWYAYKTIEYGWSRAMLTAQIETGLHRREGQAITNFSETLPAPQSDLAQQTLKDPYNFDFLTLAADARERDFELGLLDHIQKFLVELGVGFAFVGRQYRLEISGEDFSLDLLFYHLRLRCFIVVDLKMEGFKPEFAGKMNFYLSAVDDQLRHREDQPAIGLLLCKEKDRLIVEYALRDVKKPIGVADWRTRLVESLPKTLRSSLPTVAQIEAELAGDLRPRKSTKRKRASKGVAV
jgi:predicted nuclease of restriction endonuclease-like (RecB) superfamily